MYDLIIVGSYIDGSVPISDRRGEYRSPESDRPHSSSSSSVYGMKLGTGRPGVDDCHGLVESRSRSKYTSTKK